MNRRCRSRYTDAHLFINALRDVLGLGPLNGETCRAAVERFGKLRTYASTAYPVRHSGHGRWR